MHVKFLFILVFVGIAAALSPQDTIYDYNNRTVYIHLNKNLNTESDKLNQLFRIPFNAKFTSGDSISNYTITPPPVDGCSLVVTSTDLLSFCPNGTDLLAVARYDNERDKWQSIHTKSGIMYYNDSTYIHTQSDKTGVYIFFGASNYRGVNAISNRMMRLDTQTWEASDASSRIQPQPFYKSTSIKINSNTEAFFGGISSGNMLVPMSEIPLWQYNSWTERPCNTVDNVPITSRIDALILPVFYNTNSYLLNETLTTFEVSSILMLGGTDLNGTAVKPSIASLDISTYKWKWTDLTKNVSFVDEKSWSDLYYSVSNNIAAVSIYDTLMMIDTPNKNERRDLNSQNFVVKLYNATDFRHLESVDYSYLNDLPLTGNQNYRFNKNLTIALSVVIPVLFIILFCVFLTYMYKKYKYKKEEERYGREVKEIVDFYENQHKRNSANTFSSYDSDYKSSNYSDDFYSDDVKINDYEDGDNLSLNSWRRKKSEFENHLSILNKVKPNFSKKKSSNSLKRSLSNASNIIQQSLSKKNSIHSSINTFTNGGFGRNIRLDNNINKNSANENPFYSSDLYTIKSDVASTASPLPTPPPPAVPKHTAMFTLPDRTESLLYHIPENTSLTTFHSQNLGYLPLKPSPTKSSPQHSYMKKVVRSERSMSIGSSFDSSVYSASSNYYSSSPSRSPSRSPRRPLSIMSSGSVLSANDALISHLPPHGFGDIEEVNEDALSTQEVGSIKEDEANNIEVQVLVSSKRRSKLRVVNPDTQELPIVAEQDEGDISIINDRCVSSSSEKSQDSDLRKRIISDDYKDESFVE